MRNSFLKSLKQPNYDVSNGRLIFGHFLEILRKFLVLLISFYQKTISPDHGFVRHMFPFGVCRYTPTCSDYAKESLRQYGVWRGLLLALKRLGRCHPFAGSGYDPVPKTTHYN